MDVCGATLKTTVLLNSNMELKELTPFEQNGLELLKKIEDIKVENIEDVKIASDLKKDSVQILKQIDETRLSITKPINDKIKELIELARIASVPAIKARDLASEKIIEYNNIQEKIARENAEAERLRLAEEKKKQDEIEALKNKEEKTFEEELTLFSQETKVEEVIEEKPVEIVTEKIKGIRTDWKYEIENEDLIPKVFCSADSKKINEAVKNGLRVIPGVKIFEVKSFR